MSRRISGKRFDYLMREYGLDLLLSREEELRRQVPESTDRAAERAFEQMQLAVASGVPVRVGRAKAAGASAAVKTLAVAVSASVLIGVGVCAASPAVSERARSLMPQSRIRAEQGADRPAKKPGDYIIPSPGEDFEVTDESQSERVTARWFTAERSQVLVEIAYKLPDELVRTEDIEYVTAGGLPGTLYETEEMSILILWDGDVYILIEYFNAGDSALMDYAAALAATNE